MTAFKSLAMTPHDRALVFATARDRLPELVHHLDDIESIEVLDRSESSDGTIKLVNRWRAKAKVPEALSSLVRPEMLAWTDHAAWNERDHVCNWHIETAFFADRIKCSGSTRYEVAMGGRGTRVTFDGDLSIANIPGPLGGVIAKGMEAFVAALVPASLRRVVQGVGAALGK